MPPRVVEACGNDVRMKEKKKQFFKEKIRPNQKIKPFSAWSQLPTTLENFYKNYACDLSWATSISFCVVTPPTPTPGTEDDYTGNFQDTKANYVFSIIEKNENGTKSLNLNIYGLPSGYNNLLLKPTATKGTFEISIPSSISIVGTPTIKYDTDLKGFTYDLILYKGTAKKIDGKPNNSNKPDESSKSNTNTTDTSTSNSDKEKQQKLYQNILKYDSDKKFESDIKNPIPCDDFPFKIGCQNKLIGDMNQVLFNDRLDDVFDKSHLYKNLDNHGAFDAPGEKDGEISKNIYNQIMSLNENLRRKKVIKETVKKVLKERILKK